MTNYHENLTAEQIRQQMDYVRHELNDDVEQVVEDASSLGDVRAYVKAQPIGWLIAAAVAGFVAVPAKRENKATTPPSADFQNSSAAPQPQPKKSSMLGAALGMAATMATRMVMNKVATTGMGLFEQSQPGQHRQQPAYPSGNESYNQEPHTG